MVAEAAAAVVEVVEGVAALNGVVLDNSVVAVVAIGNELCDSRAYLLYLTVFYCWQHSCCSFC